VTASVDRHWLARIGTAAVGAALVLGLSSCRFDHHLSDGADSAVTGSTPAATGNPVLPTATVSAVGAGTTSAVTPGAVPRSAMSRINGDLSGIDAGNSQAGGDLSAGDSAQSHPDTP
jgi:hypothetical protein